eukprot:TRINITY_DN19890_c0_g1_i1.p1 TRINITY_DN19890_c0_g1~~TRINITY_DN19890_c0_g1_i1.p1  ORF type:complete len:327 (-),score=46.67 TRINITY_DN19890_c0_g1_i1:381-1361(-)
MSMHLSCLTASASSSTYVGQSRSRNRHAKQQGKATASNGFGPDGFSSSSNRKASLVGVRREPDNFGKHGIASQELSGILNWDSRRAVQEFGQKLPTGVAPHCQAGLGVAAPPLSVQQMCGRHVSPGSTESRFQFGQVHAEHDKSLECYSVGQHHSSHGPMRAHGLVHASLGFELAWLVQSRTAYAETLVDACMELGSFGGLRRPFPEMPGSKEEGQWREPPHAAQKRQPGMAAPGTCSPLEVQHSHGMRMSQDLTDSVPLSEFSSLSTSQGWYHGNESCRAVNDDESSDSSYDASPVDGQQNEHCKSMVRFTHVKVGDHEITIVEF